MPGFLGSAKALRWSLDIFAAEPMLSRGLIAAERLNRLAPAAVAKAMAPLVLWYVTPKSQPRRRLSEVGCFSPGETLKQLALKEATDAQVCALAIRTESEARKALNLH